VIERLRSAGLPRPADQSHFDLVISAPYIGRAVIYGTYHPPELKRSRVERSVVIRPLLLEALEGLHGDSAVADLAGGFAQTRQENVAHLGGLASVYTETRSVPLALGAYKDEWRGHDEANSC
jgi:hypothetical protein